MIDVRDLARTRRPGGDVAPRYGCSARAVQRGVPADCVALSVAIYATGELKPVYLY